MSDPWPADAEQIELARNDPRWKSSGSGPFALVTVAWVTVNMKPAGTFIAEHRVVHRFQSAAARDEFKVAAKEAGLRVEEYE